MTNVNQTVHINSFYFPGGVVDRALPRSIDFGNGRVAFNDGLQYLVGQGSSMFKLFDMSDGRKLYRLRFEPADERWTLLTIKSL